MEAVRVVRKSRIPVVKARPHVDRTLLAALLKGRRHRHADQIHGPPHEWMNVWADRFRERRNPDARREG